MEIVWCMIISNVKFLEGVCLILPKLLNPEQQTDWNAFCGRFAVLYMYVYN